MSSLRLLMTADTVGGVWTYTMELARALRGCGVEIALATMGRRLSSEQRWEVGELDHVELYESGWKLEWMESPWTEVDAAGDWLLGIESEFRPDLIHLNGYAHGALAWSAPILMVIH